jgi:hypothetical protein
MKQRKHVLPKHSDGLSVGHSTKSKDGSAMSMMYKALNLTLRQKGTFSLFNGAINVFQFQKKWNGNWKFGAIRII